METKTEDEKKAWLDVEKHHKGKNQSQERKSGRKTLEKVLLVVVLVLALAVVVLVVALVVTKVNEENTRASESGVCLTKECVSAAARINNYLDYSSPYCQDFYQFACGRWLKENIVPADKSALNTFGLLKDHVDIIIKNLLEEEVKPSDPGSVKKAKDFYRSCTDIDRINARGDKPLKDFLISKFGGWPLVTPGWTESSFDLLETLTTLIRYSNYPLFVFHVGTDNKNSSRHIFKLDQPSFGMPGQKYYLVPRNDTMLKAYETLIYSVGHLMGFVSPSTALNDVEDIVNFEIDLAKISVPDENRRDMSTLYNPMTLSHVHEEYRSILDWRAFVLNLTSQKEVGLTDITDKEVIINHSPQYFDKLVSLLAKTPKKTVANFVMWRLVRSLLLTMGDNYNELTLVYKKVLFGTTAEKPRFRTCTSVCTGQLGLAIGRMFIKENFDSSSMNVALDMIQGLKASFNELLEDLDWMDEDTKKVARDKNEHISSRIGYPEEIKDDKYLDEYYSNYTYHRDQYFENILMIFKEGSQESLRKLREIVNKTKWESAPTDVNAYYSQIKNQIMFPAGILQPPFFSKSYPMSMNYGGIGYFIGHEITHGFDDRGRQYDKQGNLVQWWTQSAEDKFKDKAQCIVDQYGNFTVSEVNMKLNGINTQGENIADNGGLKQAFRAYRNWVRKQGREEQRLPGLDFDHNQLFFINFAQLWCNIMTEGEALSRIKTGVHSPGRFRVIGSTQNSPDFAKAFNCPTNSYMNPEKKCTVW